MTSPLVVVAGLGPAGPDLVTTGVRRLLVEAPLSTPIYFRTSRHPAAVSLLSELGTQRVRTFDELYEGAESFAEVYEAIVAQLGVATAEHGRVIYVVPGSPLVAERTVELLRLSGPPLEVLPALSYCDLAWVALGVDPVAAGVRIIDGLRFATAAAGDPGPLLVAQAWSREVLSDIKLAIPEPAPDQAAVILHHLGLPDEVVVEVAWADLDRTVSADHLTSIYVPSLASPVAAEVMRAAETIATLRGACPWDKEQTHISLLRNMLEESYEAMDALEALGEHPEDATEELAQHAAEELGDVLCQVLFHANIAREEGLFDLSDVARTLADKLVRRHPHVFGDRSAETAEDVMQNWEQIKRTEKAREHFLDGIPEAMPALARVAVIERKLRAVGLGYGVAGAQADSEAGAQAGAPPGARADSQAGAPPGLTSPGAELLDLARRLASGGIDPEAELRRATAALLAALKSADTREQSSGVDPSEGPLHVSGSSL